jgi:hypothetical protein
MRRTWDFFGSLRKGSAAKNFDKVTVARRRLRCIAAAAVVSAVGRRSASTCIPMQATATSLLAAPVE